MGVTAMGQCETHSPVQITGPEPGLPPALCVTGGVFVPSVGLPLSSLWSVFMFWY